MCIAFHDSDGIMEARAKTKLAEETSNIDSETDVIEKKRKRKYTKLYDICLKLYNTGFIFKQYFLQSKEEGRFK